MFHVQNQVTELNGIKFRHTVKKRSYRNLLNNENRRSNLLATTSSLSVVPYLNKIVNNEYIQNAACKLPAADGMLNEYVIRNDITPEEALAIYAKSWTASA